MAFLSVVGVAIRVGKAIAQVKLAVDAIVISIRGLVNVVEDIKAFPDPDLEAEKRELDERIEISKQKQAQYEMEAQIHEKKKEEISQKLRREELEFSKNLQKLDHELNALNAGEKQVKDNIAKRKKENQEKINKVNEEYKGKKIQIEKEIQEIRKKRDIEFEKQERESKVRNLDYSRPAYLEPYKKNINIAVCGDSGVGKSTLINTLRGIEDDAPGAARTDVNECTMIATPYPFVQSCEKENIESIITKAHQQIQIWDLPGGGTKRFPLETYIRDFGLRYFDFVLVVTAGRTFTEVDSAIIENLDYFNIPYFPVRNKVDEDIEDNEERRGVSREETIKQMRSKIEEGLNGKRVYLISAFDLEEEGLDGKNLYWYMMEKVIRERVQIVDQQNFDDIINLNTAG